MKMQKYPQKLEVNFPEYFLVFKKEKEKKKSVAEEVVLLVWFVNSHMSLSKIHHMN